jgi:hypothetical protein
MSSGAALETARKWAIPLRYRASYDATFQREDVTLRVRACSFLSFSLTRRSYRRWVSFEAGANGSQLLKHAMQTEVSEFNSFVTV